MSVDVFSHVATTTVVADEGVADGVSAGVCVALAVWAGVGLGVAEVLASDLGTKIHAATPMAITPRATETTMTMLFRLTSSSVSARRASAYLGPPPRSGQDHHARTSMGTHSWVGL
jgi:hypothetical protein